MTYGYIKTRLLELAGQSASGEFENLINLYVNMVYQRYLDLSKVQHESREFSLVTVASTSAYGMPHGVRKITNIDDPTNLRNIYSITSRDFDVSFPGTTTTGTPSRVHPYGVFGVQKQPAAASGITIESDAAGDSGSAYSINIVGRDANGALIDEDIAPTGTTPATLTSSFTTIERVVKTTTVAAGIWAGTLILKDSAANVLCRVPKWWDSGDYQWVEFYPIPSAAVTYTVRAEMRKPPLVQDTDWPELPLEFHDLLIWGVVQDLFPKVGLDSVALSHANTHEERRQEFLTSTNTGVDNIIRRATFRNITNSPSGRARPGRPLIQNFDFV